MTHQYLLEPFLTQYYLLDAVCGSFMTDRTRKEMFGELARVFCLSDNPVLKDYYRVSEGEAFREIRDTASYQRFSRTVQFAGQSGQTVEFSDLERTVLAQKREAFAVKDELFPQRRHLTRESVSATLFATALNGNVDAMALLSFLEWHGICVCRDPDTAVKRLRLAAGWNDLFSNLMGIAYDADRKARYFDTLSTVLRHAGQKQAFDHIVASGGYDGEICKRPEARILDRAFGQGAIKRNHYDQAFAKVLFSRVISAEDKEKLLLNKPLEAIVALSDLPFDLREGRLTFSDSCVEGMPLVREEEQKKILRNVTLLRECPAEAGMPLLISAPDPYLSDLYRTMLLRGFSECAVVEIDAGTLTSEDFFGGRENIFLRGLSETRSDRTVFFIKDCEELDESRCEELMKVLDGEYRKRFKLFQPPVSLDLSGLRFLLFASERTPVVDKLAEVCDTVRVERLRESEKPRVVEDIFSSRLAGFGRPGVTLGEGCREFLSGYDTRQIRRILDGALREAVFEKTEIITPEHLKAVCAARNITEPRREFGYKGGSHYA